MAVKVKYKNKTGKAAIAAFTKQFIDIPKKINEAIPSTFYPTIANKVRGYFRQNFISMEGWKSPVLKPNYAKKKDMMRARGDSFTIGTFGNRPVSFGSEVFGKLTGTIAENIGTKSGTTVVTRASIQKDKTNVNISVAINPTLWEGGNTHHYNTKKGRGSNKTTVRNQLAAFSNRISRKGSRTSILVKLTNTQLNNLSDFIRDNYSATLRKFV